MSRGLHVSVTHLLRLFTSVQLHWRYVVTCPTSWDVTVKVTVVECVGNTTYVATLNRKREIMRLKRQLDKPCTRYHTALNKLHIIKNSQGCNDSL